MVMEAAEEHAHEHEYINIAESDTVSAYAEHAHPRGIVLRIMLGGLLLLGTLGLLDGCGGSEPKPSSPLAPDFTVKTLNGSDFTLSEHRGRVIILHALTTGARCLSCPDPRVSASTLTRIYDEYRDRGVEVLILDTSFDGTDERLLQFKDSIGRGGDHFWAVDKGNRWASAYEIKTLDSTIIVDRQGRIAYRDGSYASYQKLKQEVESLL